MKLFVLGSTGMLGQALMREARLRKIETKGAARSHADLTVDITDDTALIQAVRNERPDVIINAAALTDLTACERSPSIAYQINARPLSILAELSHDTNAYLIQISTDHYFIGDGNARHDESSPVRLVNEYARTKYAGEVFALTCPGALAVRTNIVGFRNKKDQPTFVEWAIETLKKGSPITLFDDFYTSSIHVAQLSKILLDIINKRPAGILNIASAEVSSKRAFIEEIAGRLGCSLSHAKIGSVLELAGARRAESLGLDVRKAEHILGYRLPAAKQVVDSLMTEYKEIMS